MLSKTKKLILAGVSMTMGLSLAAGVYFTSQNKAEAFRGNATGGEVINSSIKFTRATTTFKKNSGMYSSTMMKSTSYGNNIYLNAHTWNDLSSSDYNSYIGNFYNAKSECYLTFSSNNTGTTPFYFYGITSISARLASGNCQFYVYTESTDGITFTDSDPEVIEFSFLRVFSVSLSNAHYVKIMQKGTGTSNFTELT